MPLDRLFRKQILEDEELLQEEADATREEILEVYRELEVYDSEAWRRVEQKLERLAQSALSAMMIAEDSETLVLARERARVVADLRRGPDELQQKLAGLKQKLQELEGEIDG